MGPRDLLGPCPTCPPEGCPTPTCAWREAGKRAMVETAGVIGELDRMGQAVVDAEAHAAALRNALERAAPFVNRAAMPDQVYGSFCGEDPRNFHPDPECSTEEERAQHKALCAKWDAGEREPAPPIHRPIPPGDVALLGEAMAAAGADAALVGPGGDGWITVNAFGLGTTTIVDEKATSAAEVVDAALRSDAGRPLLALLDGLQASLAAAEKRAAEAEAQTAALREALDTHRALASGANRAILDRLDDAEARAMARREALILVVDQGFNRPDHPPDQCSGACEDHKLKAELVVAIRDDAGRPWRERLAAAEREVAEAHRRVRAVLDADGIDASELSLPDALTWLETSTEENRNDMLATLQQVDAAGRSLASERARADAAEAEAARERSRADWLQGWREGVEPELGRLRASAAGAHRRDAADVVFDPPKLPKARKETDDG